MNPLKTLKDIEDLIDNQIEESTELEYKSSVRTPNPKWKEEVAKDVSAMANANGGVIIYGIREKSGENGHSIPSEITPIPVKDMSKDSLMQIISANIQPKIENIEINTIEYDANNVLYVVCIPQSITAHQNKLTKQYHIRRNSVIEAMEDYEIRDIMNRVKHPLIELDFEIIKTITVKKQIRQGIMSYENPFAAMTIESEESRAEEFRLEIYPKNIGQTFANYVNYFVYLPQNIIKDPELYDCQNSNQCRIYGDNTIRDVIDHVQTYMGGGYNKYGPSRYDPILPGRYGVSLSVELSNDLVIDNRVLKWEIYADNAPQRVGQIKLNEIKLTEIRVEKEVDNRGIF